MQIYWGKVASFIHGHERSNSDYSYWLDEVAIVPKYDKKEYEVQLLLAEEKRKDEIPQDVVLFDDRPLSSFWTTGDAYSRVVVDETVRRKGKKSLRIYMSVSGGERGTGDTSYIDKAISDALEVAMRECKPGQCCKPGKINIPWDKVDSKVKAGISLPEIDLSKFWSHGAMEFYVRGGIGDEHFRVVIFSRHGVAEERRAILPSTRQYTILNDKWQKLSIPLIDFRQFAEFDPERVMRIELTTTPDPQLEFSFYLDDVRFVPRPTIEGNVEK